MKHEEIYIDVDGTLIDHNNNLYSGVREALAYLNKWYTLVCWSFGGADYARSVCESHSISEQFVRFETKPQIVIDDDFDWIAKYPRKFKITDGDWSEVLNYCGIKKDPTT